MRGSSSPIRTPGRLVGIVAYLPRTSAAASGLGSNESWCDRPPPRKTRITDRARAGALAAASASNSAGSASPSGASPPTRRKWRRVAAVWRPDRPVETSNIVRDGPRRPLSG